MSHSAQPRSGAELLDQIRPRFREESTELCLRPDLLDEWANLQDELSEIQAAGLESPRLASGESGKAKAKAAAILKLEDEIAATSVRFVFRAMPAYEWRALCDNHPPRQTSELDRAVGYDRDAVLDAMVRHCLIDPVFDEASWQRLLDVCNPSEWAELRRTANSVNRGVVDAPKSELASRILAKRGSASK